MATDGDTCRHDMLRRTCTFCDPPDRRARAKRGDDPGAVYFTARGDRYHDTADCSALTGGQSGADSQDMHVYGIESGTVEVARGKHLTPCGSCRPLR